MASEIWPDGAITIVLLPSSEQGEDLLNLAREWTQNGVLSPAMWVNPGKVDLSPETPPEVIATLFAGDKQGGLVRDEVSVFDVLAVESLKTVRLIKVRSALPNHASDEAQDRISESLSRYIAAAMPRSGSSSGINGDGLSLYRFTLVCAPTQFRIQERVNAEVRDSTTLILASPEDRALPDSGDAFIRDNERFQGFVLMHTATIGGLWAGLPIGSFEVVKAEKSLSNQIWIPRVFVTGVLSGGLSMRIAASVLDEIRSNGITVGGAPIVTSGTALIPEIQAQSYVDRMLEVGIQLDDSALLLHKVELAPEPLPESISLMRQIWHFIRFSGGKLARIPHWMVVSSHDSAARKASKRLQGDSGKFSIEMLEGNGIDPRDQAMIDTAQRAEYALNQTPSTISRRATPRLWSGLRHLFFGALDGGEGVRDVFPTIENRLPVFGSADFVVPSPEQSWQHPGKPPTGFPERLDWLTVRADPSLRSSLEEESEERLKELKDRENQLTADQERLAKATQTLEERTAELVELGLLKYRSDGQVAAAPRKNPEKAVEPQTQDSAAKTKTPSKADLSPQDAIREYRDLKGKVNSLESAVAKTEGAIRSAIEKYEQAKAILDSFDEWVSELSKSLSWQLINRTESEILRGKEMLAAAESAKSDLPEIGELVRLRKRFHRGLIVALSVILPLTALALLLPLIARSLPSQSTDSNDTNGNAVQTIVKWLVGIALSKYYPPWWEILLWVLGGLLLIILGLLIRYYSGWSQFERRVQLVTHRMESMASRVSGLRSEVNRLLLQREQLVEWVVLMSSAIHRPWVVPPRMLEGSDNGISVSRLPFALHLATAVSGSGTSTERLREATANSFLKQGWRAQAFESMLGEIRQRLGQDQSRFSAETLDSDLPDASNGSRLRLKAHLNDTEILEQVAESLVERLTDQVQDKNVYEAGIAVRPIRKDPLAAFRSLEADNESNWRDFLEQTLGDPHDAVSPLSTFGIAPQELQKAHHERVTTYVLAPQEIAVDIQSQARKNFVVQPYVPSPGTGLDVVIRMDMIGPIPLGAVGLWSEREFSLNEEPLFDAPVCPNCGRATCPAADPESNLPCDETGI